MKIEIKRTMIALAGGVCLALAAGGVSAHGNDYRDRDRHGHHRGHHDYGHHDRDRYRQHARHPVNFVSVQAPVYYAAPPPRVVYQRSYAPPQPYPVSAYGYRAGPNFGSAVGGAVGGLVGSQIGKGSGKLAATAAGAVAGYVIGGQMGAAYPY